MEFSRINYGGSMIYSDSFTGRCHRQRRGCCIDIKKINVAINCVCAQKQRILETRKYKGKKINFQFSSLFSFVSTFLVPNKPSKMR